MEQNIYQLARETKGMTQEKAAEILGICTKSLRDYELDNIIPKNKVVAKMVDLYDTQWLAYRHLRNTSESNILPKIEIRTLEGASIKFLKEFKDVEKLKDKLIEITEDGKVDSLEKKDWQEIIKEIKELVGAIITLECAK